MRTVQFRAWDKQNKKWLELHNLILDYQTGKVIGYIEFCGLASCPLNMIELQQATGLKDETGKDIFEGDILFKYGDNYNGVVEWNEEDQSLEGLGWIIHEYYPVGEYDRYHTISAYTSPKRIIGNIYENSELIHKWGLPAKRKRLQIVNKEK